MTLPRSWILIGLLLVAQFSLLYLAGQPFFCQCGPVKLWEGNVSGDGNSQQLSDWYTFSHIIHGFLFFGLLWLLFPKMPLGRRLAIAVGIEIGWELLENSPWVIDRYRMQALAAGYSGDSILNSLSDSFSMMFGFLIAYRFPIYVTIALGIFFELWTGYLIRDNLTLNVIQLIYPLDWVNAWQAAL